MHLKMFFIPGDPNPMIRVSSVQRITRSDLKQIQRECLRRFESFPAKSKGLWMRMANAAEGALLFRDIPHLGLDAVGPFVGNTLRLPRRGDVLRLNPGIDVFSDMPSMLGKRHREQQSRDIRVSEVSAGFVNYAQSEVMDPMIHWQLNNGYKAWTSAKNMSAVGLEFHKLAS